MGGEVAVEEVGAETVEGDEDGCWEEGVGAVGEGLGFVGGWREMFGLLGVVWLGRGFVLLLLGVGGSVGAVE